jgi:hypothetical protein
MAAGSLRYEAGPEDVEPHVLEPGNVRGQIGVAPVHPRAMPIAFRPSPGLRTHYRQQVTAGSEPATDLLEDRGLLLDRHMDDRVEGDDGGKTLRWKLDGRHVGALKLRSGHELARSSDLDGRYVHAGHRVAIGEDCGGRHAAPTPQIEDRITLIEQWLQLRQPRFVIRPSCHLACLINAWAATSIIPVLVGNVIIAVANDVFGINRSQRRLGAAGVAVERRARVLTLVLKDHSGCRKAQRGHQQRDACYWVHDFEEPVEVLPDQYRVDEDTKA